MNVKEKLEKISEHYYEKLKMEEKDIIISDTLFELKTKGIILDSKEPQTYINRDECYAIAKLVPELEGKVMDVMHACRRWGYDVKEVCILVTTRELDGIEYDYAFASLFREYAGEYIKYVGSRRLDNDKIADHFLVEVDKRTCKDVEVPVFIYLVVVSEPVKKSK